MAEKRCVNAAVYVKAGISGFIKPLAPAFRFRFPVSVFLVLALFAASPAHAAEKFPFISEGAVKRVSSLDLSRGRISGEEAQYYMDIPSAWRDNVLAERVRQPEEEGVVEQINFYCSAISGIYKPQLLMALSVFDKALWQDDGRYEPALKSRDYVFAVKYGRSGFALKGDVTVYNSVRAFVDTPFKIAKMVALPQTQQIAPSGAVFVDGGLLFYPAELKGEIYYVRLREAAAAMGYTVSWNARTSTATVSGGSFPDFVRIEKNGADWRGKKMSHIDGRIYVSTAYFFRVFGKTVEIDKDKNIYFYSE
jgi:hypothetical protein